MKWAEKPHNLREHFCSKLLTSFQNIKLSREMKAWMKTIFLWMKSADFFFDPPLPKKNNQLRHFNFWFVCVSPSLSLFQFAFGLFWAFDYVTFYCLTHVNELLDCVVAFMMQIFFLCWKILDLFFFVFLLCFITTSSKHTTHTSGRLTATFEFNRNSSKKMHNKMYCISNKHEVVVMVHIFWELTSVSWERGCAH